MKVFKDTLRIFRRPRQDTSLGGDQSFLSHLFYIIMHSATFVQFYWKNFHMKLGRGSLSKKGTSLVVIGDNQRIKQIYLQLFTVSKVYHDHSDYVVGGSSYR